jgi:hypothetical protein
LSIPAKIDSWYPWQAIAIKRVKPSILGEVGPVRGMRRGGPQWERPVHMYFIDSPELRSVQLSSDPDVIATANFEIDY